MSPPHTSVAVVDNSTLRRVLDTFREFRVGSNVFAGVDGYGHGDIGRETLDKVYARLFGAEAALVNCFFFCRPWRRYRRCRLSPLSLHLLRLLLSRFYVETRKVARLSSKG